jgi:hypothetical protein
MVIRWLEGWFIIFVAATLHLLELVFYAIQKNHDNIFPFLHQVTLSVSTIEWIWSSQSLRDNLSYK